MLSNKWLYKNMPLPPTDKTDKTDKIPNSVSNVSIVSDPLIQNRQEDLYQAMSSAIADIAKLYNSSFEVERVFKDEIERLDSLVMSVEPGSIEVAKITKWRDGWIHLLNANKARGADV